MHDASLRPMARHQMPPPLRRDVRLLGELLGRVLVECGGPDLLDDVEALRRTVIAARDSDAQERRAKELVAGWSLERAEEVARAFTCYFHLANLAEEQHRARVLRDRDREGDTLQESLAATIEEIRAEQGPDRLADLLGRLDLHLVLTAHPTEARRRAVVAAIRRIGDHLARLDDPSCSRSERRDARRGLLEEIETLWRTDPLRSTPLRPMDEVRAALAVFDWSLLEVVPLIYRELDVALSPEGAGTRPPLAPAFLHVGSWVGGDRDGNPNVTADVTAAAMREASGQALAALERAIADAARRLTTDDATTPPLPALAHHLAAARIHEPDLMEALVQRSPREPHRQFLLLVAERVAETRRDRRMAYAGPGELLDDLRLLQRSLEAAGARRLAWGRLQDLVWQVETFGFHLVQLEVRQHSGVHSRALAEVRSGRAHSAQTEEVLATLRVMAHLQRRYGVDACRRYVVSFTHRPEDVADVFTLAGIACAGEPPVLDVVPLFETQDDLAAAPGLLDAMLELGPVRERLEENGRRVEVMLGYSDSAKEAGPVTATLALFDAQAELAAWARRHRVQLTIFHGRGGALGRGGGPANRAVLAQAPGSVGGRFKVTEQGEVIFARYGHPAIASRHLQQISSAVLLASSPELERSTAAAAERFAPLAATISGAARRSYRELVEAPDFARWFAAVSPLEELGELRIGSRPSRRGGSLTLDDLRAIPWVFAWSQTRLNLPGWYGLGSGLAAASLEELREAYAEWPLFTSLIDNAEMSLAKTDRRIASRYLALGGRPELTARLLTEYDLTVERVLAVTDHTRLLQSRRVLSWAVELRNPYVDALSHLQLRALESLRRDAPGEEQAAVLRRLLLLTVNGVAAGLQNTG